MKCWKIKSQLLCPLIISTFEEEEDFGKINSLHPAQKRPIAKSRELQFLRIWNFKGHHRISHKKIIKLQITSGLISQKYDDWIPWFFDRTWIVSLSDDRKKIEKKRQAHFLKLPSSLASAEPHLLILDLIINLEWKHLNIKSNVKYKKNC